MLQKVIHFFTKSVRLLQKFKPKKSIIWIISYFFTVAVFALIYWLAWMKSPDSFIVHKELNLYPIHDLYSNLWEGIQPPARNPIAGLDELHEIFSKNQARSSSATLKLKEYESQEKALEKQLSDAADIHSNTMWENAKTFEEKELRPLESLRMNKSEEINLLEKLEQEDRDRLRSFYYVQKLSELRLELSNIELKIAKKKLELSYYVLGHLGEFADSLKENLVVSLNKELLNVREQTSNLREELRKLTVELDKNLWEWWRSRATRLGFLDFLYFSAGISTTATFGDILPNSKWIRFFVTVQLLLCVIIVGGFVTVVTQQVNK